MMIGDTRRTYPTVEIPTWPVSEEFTAGDVFSPVMNSPDCSMIEALAALQRYLPSNEPDPDSDPDLFGPDSPINAYSCDHFRMCDFKVRRCACGRSQDWTECPNAHPGEKARRRDPRKYSYSGSRFSLERSEEVQLKETRASLLTEFSSVGFIPLVTGLSRVKTAVTVAGESVSLLTRRISLGMEPKLDFFLTGCKIIYKKRVRGIEPRTLGNYGCNITNLAT